MRRIPLRWALPIFHLAMDAILVAMLTVETADQIARTWERRPVAFQEDVQAFQFHVRVIERNSFELLFSGTLPASLLSQWAMDDKAKAIDWRRLAIFEGTAVTFWFFLGWIADRGQVAVCRWSLALVLIRIVAISLSVSRYRGVGWRIQTLFWLSAAIYSTVAAIGSERVEYDPIDQRPTGWRELQLAASTSVDVFA